MAEFALGERAIEQIRALIRTEIGRAKTTPSPPPPRPPLARQDIFLARAKEKIEPGAVGQIQMMGGTEFGAEVVMPALGEYPGLNRTAFAIPKESPLLAIQAVNGFDLVPFHPDVCISEFEAGSQVIERIDPPAEESIAIALVKPDPDECLFRLVALLKLHSQCADRYWSSVGGQVVQRVGQETAESIEVRIVPGVDPADPAKCLEVQAEVNLHRPGDFRCPGDYGYEDPGTICDRLAAIDERLASLEAGGGEGACLKWVWCRDEPDNPYNLEGDWHPVGHAGYADETKPSGDGRVHGETVVVCPDLCEPDPGEDCEHCTNAMPSECSVTISGWKCNGVVQEDLVFTAFQTAGIPCRYTRGTDPEGADGSGVPHGCTGEERTDTLDCVIEYAQANVTASVSGGVQWNLAGLSTPRNCSGATELPFLDQNLDWTAIDWSESTLTVTI